jgi:hypothetical protein
MKTNYLKGSMLLIGMLAITMSAGAQKRDTTKRRIYADRYSNRDEVISSSPGHEREHVTTNWHGRYYEMTLLNNKMTAFYVEGEKIPEAKWGEYKSVIDGIREQLRRDKIQAKKDQEQAGRDQQQAARDQEQAQRDQVQAQKDQEEAKKDQEQAVRDQEQAKKDEEQAARDQEQAKKDQEQAVRDQIQAKQDQEEAAEDQRQLKLLVADLVADKIVPDKDSVRDMTLNPYEMTINGVKQPDEVFKKYRDKYPRFSKGYFSFGEDSGSGNMHMSRHSISQ